MALARASIVTPGDWIELDLHPATWHTSIRRSVRQAVVRSRGLAPDAVPLIALLDRTCRRAVDTGAFYCASRVLKDASGDVVVVTVLMQVRPAMAPLPDVPPGMSSVSVGERCAALADVVGRDPRWTGAASPHLEAMACATSWGSSRKLTDPGALDWARHLWPRDDGTFDFVTELTCQRK